jgi:hypothetical protein
VPIIDAFAGNPRFAGHGADQLDTKWLQDASSVTLEKYQVSYPDFIAE